MIRPVSHPGTGQVMDIAAATPGDIAFLAELHHLTARDQGLVCETAGGDDEARRLSVYKRDGSYWCRHFPGHGHHADHRVTAESDAHKRGKDYALAAFDREGITAAPEVSSDRKTRSDVVAFGAVVVAAEIQASARKPAAIKARDTRARRATAITTPGHAQPLTAGIQPVWAQIHDGDADWLHQVPSVRTTLRFTVWEDHMPEARSVGAAGIRTIDPEPCRAGSRWDRCPYRPGGFCGGWHGYAAVRGGLSLDDVFVHAATGLLLPVRYHTGHVYLTDPASIATYTELGADCTWHPGEPAAAYRHVIGPCRYRAHTQDDEQARVTAEAQAERDRRTAELARFARERDERERVITEMRQREWAGRERRERHARERRQQPAGPAPAAAQPCSCHGCPRPARQWPGGWWCDTHPCRGCHCQPWRKTAA
jgi:hypothetical protein